jgi:hypothetical protein
MQNPNLDREFTYESVNVYYTAKIAKFEFRDLVLPTFSFSSLDELVDHLRSVQTNYHIQLPNCMHDDMFTWAPLIDSMRTDDALKVWVFRDYCFSLCMITIGEIFGSARESWSSHISREIPDDLNISNNRFTVIGSQKLSSDIDVTIQGPYSSVIISVIEDIFESLTYDHQIPLRCMDVEFYGDFRILNNLYVNVGMFTATQRVRMLEYAYISYFRSLHIYGSSFDVSPLARRLGEIYLRRMGSSTSLDTLMQSAFSDWSETAPNGTLNREIFYKENANAEAQANQLKPRLIVKGNTQMTQNSNNTNIIANEIFFSVARGNIHRAESYILPSTAVHVVEIEQVMGNKEGDPASIPKSWFADNAYIGVDDYAYIASAIEQLGYLEHYHPKTDVACMKKGVKYFGRMVRGLLHARLLNASYEPIYKAMNDFRKSETNTQCPGNIHKLLNTILTDLQTMTGGRRQRSTLRRYARRRQTRRIHR